MKRAALFVLTLILLVGSSNAQKMEPPTRVGVTHSGNDVVGQTLAYQVREQIKSSDQMKLVDATNKTAAYVRVSVVTVDPFSETGIDRVSSTYSCTWSYRLAISGRSTELLLTSRVGTVASGGTKAPARNIAAITDEQRRKVPQKMEDLGVILREAAAVSQ